MFALCYHSDCYPLPPTQHSFFRNIPPLFVCHNASLIQNINLKLTEFSNSKMTHLNMDASWVHLQTFSNTFVMKQFAWRCTASAWSTECDMLSLLGVLYTVCFCRPVWRMLDSWENFSDSLTECVKSSSPYIKDILENVPLWLCCFPKIRKSVTGNEQKHESTKATFSKPEEFSKEQLYLTLLVLPKIPV